MKHHPLFSFGLILVGSSFAASVYAQQAIALSANGALVTFSVTAPGTALATAPLTGLAAGETLVGLDHRPLTRALIGVTNQSRLVTLNATTGAATPLSTLSVPLAGTAFGVDFNPAADRLRIVSNTGQSLRVNVETGAVTVDGALAYAAGDANAGATPQVSSAAYTNSIAGRTPATTVLFDIDYARDVLVRQDPPNNGTLVTVGRLGFDFGEQSGLDIFSPTTAFASTVVGGGGSNFYSVSLTTGAATLVGTFPAGVTVVDFSLVPKEPAQGVINTSVRGLVGPGEAALIAGFVVAGPSPVNVLVTTRGPSLTQFGVAVALVDPQLRIWNSAGQSIDQNDDWQAHPRAVEITATGFAPLNAKESALLLTLPPGSYTATVSGVGTSANGVATIEVYELP